MCLNVGSYLPTYASKKEIMCKIFSVIYLSLFLTIVDCFDMQDGPHIKEDIKHPNHRHSHKARSTINNLARKTRDGGESNPTTTEEPKGNTEEKDTEELFTEDNAVKEEQIPETAIEINFGRTRDTYRKTFVDSSSKTQEISEGESSSSDDYSDSYDSDKESLKVEKVDNLTDEIGYSNHSGEVLINTPNRITLSQDAVLDLKARSGNIRAEEDESDGDMNVPDNNITSIEQPQFDTHMRSGYIPPEAVDNVLKPPENTQNDVYHLNRPISTLRNGQPSQFYYQNNSHPEMLYNSILNSRPRYFENIRSQEILYPKQNSREIWADQNEQRTKPYFGETHPNNQYTRLHNCPMCTQGRYSSRERTFQAAEPSRTLETANGRSVEFDPIGANNYPLTQDKDADKVNRAQTSFNEILNPGSKEKYYYAAKEVDRDVHLSNMRSDQGPFSNFLMTLPSYVSRNQPVLRWVGLGGSRFVI